MVVSGSGVIAAGCSSGSPVSSSGKAHSVRPPDWEKLADALSGPLLRPGHTGYGAAAHLYNSLYSPNPAAIAQCQTASDVQRCMAFARTHNVELRARSGGHSYAAYSSCPGLVIDLSPMNGTSVSTSGTPATSAARDVATIGAGAQLIDVYTQLNSHGLLLPGGSCPTVGIAGLALGGGIGVFSRAYGLTCDQVVGVDIVTADGVLRKCGPTQHSDLYWACRGGGGGNFGVVTSFDFRVQPIPDAITLFTLEWPWGAAGSVLDAWIRWIPSTPPELWANCQLFSSGNVGTGLIKVTGVFVGSVAACSSALDSMTSAVGQATTYRFVGPVAYIAAMMIEAGCEGQTLAQCETPVEAPFATKSSYVGGPLPERSISTVIAALSNLPTTLPGAGGGVVFDSYGGMINEVAANDTAFVHRSAVACAQISITYPTSAPDAAMTATAHTWLQGVDAALEPAAQGAYQNYIDPTQADWPQAYYGANLPRLQKIKRKYDPDDIFHFAQSIPPN